MSTFDQVLSFIHRPEPKAFEQLALEVFRYQAKYVAPYRDYLDGLGIVPAHVRTVADIPPVSTLALKYALMESGADHPFVDSRLFLTSGTPTGRAARGRHVVLKPEIYRASALGHL